jgi:hypothetical protein
VIILAESIKAAQLDSPEESDQATAGRSGGKKKSQTEVWLFSCVDAAEVFAEVLGVGNVDLGRELASVIVIDRLEDDVVTPHGNVRIRESELLACLIDPGNRQELGLSAIQVILIDQGLQPVNLAQHG